jgi:hypothetical protein
MARIDAPYVVNAVQMVGMGVGHQDTIQPVNFMADQLFAEIRRGIH